MSCGAGIQAHPGKRRRRPSQDLQQAGLAGIWEDRPIKTDGCRPKPGFRAMA
jgi:hypothetical protein